VNYNGIPGPKGQFLGVCSVVSRVAFSFIGTEAVAMAAAEARNPRRNIPKAIKKIYFRILVLYIGSVFIIGLLVPSNDPSLDSTSSQPSTSPFVIAFQEAGIKVVPSIINAAIITSAWSSSSSDLYIASRTLHGLAVSGSAPKIFSRTTRSGLPHVAVGVCSCFAFLAYLTVKDGPNTVFNWLSGFCTTAGIITWFGIGVTYLRFYKGMKAQGIDRRKKLPFAPRVQPFAAWWCVCGTAFVLLFSAWDVFLKGNWSAILFVTDYVPIVFFPILYVAAKLIMGVPTVKADKMDFVTDVAECDAMTFDGPEPGDELEAFRMWPMPRIPYPLRRP